MRCADFRIAGLGEFADAQPVDGGLAGPEISREGSGAGHTAASKARTLEPV
jgi:hypothetical protein